MTAPIPLCLYEDAGMRRQLVAVVDELTLTYAVVARDAAGETRVLRRHLPTLRAARRWALAHARDER